MERSITLSKQLLFMELRNQFSIILEIAMVNGSAQQSCEMKQSGNFNEFCMFVGFCMLNRSTL